MNETVFAECVASYCTATGAGIGVRETLLANYRVIVGAWKVTPREFGDIAFRLVSQTRIPNWPKEHTEAIGRELDAIRKDRIAATSQRRGSHDCPVCDNLGIVTVPRPCCVRSGRVVPCPGFHSASHGQTCHTTGVICTAPRCYRGEAAKASSIRFADETGKPRVMSMDTYLKRVGQHVEPTTILREWDHARAEASRIAEPHTDRERDVFRSVIGNILARQDAAREAALAGYRDPAEVDEEAIPA